jgi:hypothetical protein
MSTCGADGPGAANGFVIICRWHVAPDADNKTLTASSNMTELVKRRFATSIRSSLGIGN